MNLDKPKFDKKQEYSDGKYEVYTLSGEKDKYRRISCNQESICILPFDRNDHSQIRHLYLVKYEDYLLGGTDFMCLTDTFNKNEYDSHYNAVESCIESKMGLNNVDVNDVFYLGKIKHSIPFSKEYRCYALDLSNYTHDHTGYKLDSSNFIEKVRFSTVVKGEVADSLVLACGLLLLSYISE